LELRRSRPLSGLFDLSGMSADTFTFVDLIEGAAKLDRCVEGVEDLLREWRVCETDWGLNEKAPTCGAFAEPSDGLEPSTPSLPCAPTGNRWQPVATVLAC